MQLFAFFIACVIAAPAEAGGGVVINEIMYHPPAGRKLLQYIEVLNAGTAEVDISGWSFSKGVVYHFPAGSRLEPGGYRIICRNREAFQAAYGEGVVPLGQFEGKL